MKSNRRKFFQNIVAVAGTTYVASEAFSQMLTRKDGFISIDWKQVASSFSISQDKLYFNNGTLGPSPKQVIEAQLYKINLVNSTGNYGDIESSKKKLAAFIGVESSDIALTHNTSEGINILANGLALKRGQRILITNHEHVGGALPWLNRAKIEGLGVDVATLGNNPMETLENIKKMVTSKTKVIAVPHIACTTGHLQPIEELATWSKAANIKLIVDGAHGAGLIPLNLGQTNIDYYAGCCHKWMCGPKGTGFLFIRSSALETIQPKFVGAGSDGGWKTSGVERRLIEKYAAGTGRFQYGTQNTELWHGLEAAIDFFETIGIENIYKHNQYLCSLFKKGVANMPQYELLTPADKDASAGMVTIRHKSIRYKELNNKLSKEKIRARIVPEHDIDAVRFSFHLYNTNEQIEYLLDTLKSI